MSNPRPFTPEEEAAMREMFANGAGVGVVARELGRAEKSVRAWSVASGVRELGQIPKVWPEARVAELRRLFDLDLSFNLIAAKLHITRNAAIGKASRMGWTRDLSSAKHRVTTGQALRNRSAGVGPKRERPAPKRRLQHNNFAGFNRDRKAASPKLEVPRFVPVVDVTNAKPWTERAFGECAYPIAGEGADTLSCCAQTAGKTYCAAHRAVMFVPPKPPGEPSRSFRPGFSRGRAAA